MSFHRLFPDDLDFGFNFNPFAIFTNAARPQDTQFDNNVESSTHESFSSTSIVNGKRVTHTKKSYKDSTGLERTDEYRSLGDGRSMRYTLDNSNTLQDKNATPKVHTFLEGVDSSASFNKAWKERNETKKTRSLLFMPVNDSDKTIGLLLE